MNRNQARYIQYFFVMGVALIIPDKPLAATDIYQWTDEKGHTHYASHPPASSSEKSRVIKLYNDASPATVNSNASNVVETFKYYDIYPVNGASLFQELNKRTPILTDGKKYHGYTKWSVHWRFNYKNNISLCSIDSVTTRVEINYLLPKMGAEKDIEPTTLRNFNRFYQALLLHEKGHAEFATQAAREIENALRATPPAPQCDDVGNRANAIGHNILKKQAKAEKYYDERTRHGETQGASAKGI